MSSLSSTFSLSPFGSLKEAQADPALVRQRIEQLYASYERSVFAKTNQLFWWLLIAQWAFAVLIAAVWSPFAWAGAESSLHPHLLAAIFIGAIIVLPPLVLIRELPHHPVTRHATAIAQVTFSSLLIHLTGGRLETHFHVFGSLAFIALYRDWRVIVTATLVVALDHLVRGIWFPLSVYGVPFASYWRTLEHAAWVVFEDVVLIWACHVSRREMWEICRRDDQNRQLLEQLEQRVRDRTSALLAEAQKHERTAAELRSSEERFRNLVNNAPIGIFKTTRAGEVRFANPYQLRLLGLPPETDYSKLNLANGALLDLAQREALWEKLEEHGEVRGFEAAYTRTDGVRLEVMINARLLPANGTEPQRCEGTVEDISAQKRALRDLETVHQQLVVASRQAGMAEVATGVLHNVGNVLTSVNITIQELLDRLKQSRITLLHRVVETFQREQHRLGAFLTEDPNGKRFPEFLAKLDTHLTQENAQMKGDAESLVRHFAHIREVIVTQQSASRLFGVSENLPASQLVEDALKLTAESLRRHEVSVSRAFVEAPPVKADRHRVLQILVNLLKNAKDSVLSAGLPTPSIVVGIAPAAPGFVALVVKDNGLGIPKENLTKIFSHGFTTKRDGHGFGLHSCVLAARDMKGDLTVASEGVGRGATFTLTLPVSGASL